MITSKIFEAYGIKWKIVHNSIVPFNLPHLPIELSNEHAIKLIKDRGAYLVRWESEFDRTSSVDWWHVIKDSEPRVEFMKSKVRNQIYRGLKKFRIEKCDRSVVQAEGYRIYKIASDKYEGFEKIYSQDQFISMINNAPSNIEFFGAFNISDNSLVAFSENVVDENACFYSTMWFLPESLRDYVSYALIYKMNVHYLFDRKFTYVSDGAKSISHQTNIQLFLQEKFGFRKAYAKLNIVYDPYISFFVKCAYPFRNFIQLIPISPFKKISILLKQEKIRRSCF